MIIALKDKIFKLSADKSIRIDAQTFVSGHGDIQDKSKVVEYIKFASDYLKDLKAEVMEHIDQGAFLEQIKQKVQLSKYESPVMNEMLLPYNIEGVYGEIMEKKLGNTQLP